MSANENNNMMMGKIDDEVVELRFSNINVDTEELISGIISDEFEDIVEEYADATAERNTNRGTKTANRLSAISFSKGTDGRPSILSVRPSLMSLGMSDRLLEKVMEDLSDPSLDPCDLPPQEQNSSDNASDTSWAMNVAAPEGTNGDLYNDDRHDSFGASPSVSAPTLADSPSSNPFTGVAMESHSEQFHAGGNYAKGRISMTADPLVFGAGGIPIPIDAHNGENHYESTQPFADPAISQNIGDQTYNDSISPPPLKRPFAMRFSVSRRTLNMLDDDFFHDFSPHSSGHENDEHPKPVNVVSSEMQQTYLNETEEVFKAQELALTREMEKIAVHDQDKVNFEVHGIPHMGTLNVEPVNTDWYLHQLEMELQSTIQDNSAFQEAQRMNPSYVNSKTFRLMFLRTFWQESTFDVKQAAAKIALYFSTKKLIFGGGEILGRDVRLSDLSVDDRAAMDCGALQTMPDRDAAGRVVILYAPGQRVFNTVENWLRAMWYMLSVTAKDEDNQKSGMVMVVYLRGFTNRRDTFEQAKKITMVRDSIPLKIVGLHYCYNDESMRALVTAQKVHFLTRNQRSHTREHLARHDDICFRLETYGIHVDKCILLENGHLGMAWYNQWIRLRGVAEVEMVASSGTATTPRTIDTTIVPKKFDVLFGRGRNTREHCGNLRCAHLVEMHQLEYENCSKPQKTALALKIVDMVKECGGKFLKKDRKYGWQEVPDTAAREKVSHFFRHLRSTKSSADDDKQPGVTESQKRSAPC
ncbi:unnamed protein product [Pseudo-nitzschia multistriata]|uniref:DUF6824 domain-containing protein n=1 Tax=Pseudo-nitzschia multistriata TaxID=183589 RepID=A0A448YVJ8_9STRA|nr:unnamed protein product [Pseudo-nitzschia multistriata]